MTEYSMFSTADLIEFASKRDNRTPLEQELAERLYHAHDILCRAEPIEVTNGGTPRCLQ